MKKHTLTSRATTISPLLAGLVALSFGYSAHAQVTISGTNGVAIKSSPGNATITGFANDGTVTIPKLAAPNGGYVKSDANGVLTVDTGVGPKGDKGDIGPQGPQGPQGIQGIPGIAGTPGQNGTDGINGTNGTNGANGTNGEKGDAGASMLSGANDPDANVGKVGDTYVNLTTGATFSNKPNSGWESTGLSLKGPTGDVGALGPKGADGLPGTPGQPGAAGEKGDKGDIGPQGPQGLQGVPGSTSIAALGLEWKTSTTSDANDVTANCSTGKKVIGGGGTPANNSQSMRVSSPTAGYGGWRVTYSGNGGGGTAVAYAICINAQ